MVKADLLITGASELATPLGREARAGSGQDSLSVIKGGCLAAMEREIVFVGSEEEMKSRVELLAGATTIDAEGGTVLPGFVDPHTHAVFAGERPEEFDMRLRGRGYAEIAKAGGGILSTVRATRAASEDELVEIGKRHLDSMLAHGTTTVEIKSGYGLELETELKMLRAIRRLSESHPLTVIPTFLGAHEVPPEYRSRPDGMNHYADLVVNEMIPAVAAEGLAQYCDIFTETGVFDLETSRRILIAAREAGMGLKVHADQLTPLGGAELAAELGAISAEHLEFVSDKGISKMAEAGTIAIPLPGAAFFLMMKDYPPARAMIEAGVPVALATDFNPGSSHCESMPVMIALACLMMKMSVAEAIVAATLNAAAAVGLADSVGSLEPGKRADAIVIDAPSHYHLVYHWGVNLLKRVVKDGDVLSRPE
ncbi:MAG TPA: imidazolonepropionase [Acidobacteriota bacterium]|nr:imidazolonepropionase [Acidobacteriota bacterium]